MLLRHIEFNLPLIGIHTEVDSTKIDNQTLTSNEQEGQGESDEQKRIAIAERTAAVLVSVQRSLRTIEDNQREAHSELTRATVELATLISENVIRRAINANEYGVEELVEQTLERIAGQDGVTIYLNPTDAKQISEQQTDADQHAFHDLNIQADASLRRGDCRADAGYFGMQTTVEQHLADLRQWLLEGLDDEIATIDEGADRDSAIDGDSATDRNDATPGSIL